MRKNIIYNKCATQSYWCVNQKKKKFKKIRNLRFETEEDAQLAVFLWLRLSKKKRKVSRLKENLKYILSLYKIDSIWNS
jgi:hypothetical protein